MSLPSGSWRLGFDEPLWLLIALLALPIIVLGVRCFRSMSLLRRWCAIAARVLLLLLIAALLAGMSVRKESDRLAIITIIDTSGSVQRYFHPPLRPDGSSQSLSDAVQTFLTSSTALRRPDDLLGLITVGPRPVALSAPQTPHALPEILLDPSIREGTDLASALRLAAAMIPPDAAGRVVLFSDGVETTGDSLAVARELVARTSASGHSSFPIDTVPLNYTVTHEVSVESVDSPPTAPAGSRITVRVVLSASGAAAGSLSLLHEGEPLDINGDLPGLSLPLSLHAGRNIQLIPLELPQGRIHRFTAVWEPAAPSDSSDVPSDTVLTNNSVESFTVSPGQGDVLIVNGVHDDSAVGGFDNDAGPPPDASRALERTLRRAGLTVRSIAPEVMPADLMALQAFDLVILQDVPADAVPERTQAALAAYVADLGGGLIMLGGRRSFGAGGWKASALEPMLPVLLDVPQRLIVPSSAIVLVIDNSGSMNRTVSGSGASQQDVANAGAALAIESMDKTDLIGVISFNSSHTVEIPLAPNTDPKAAAARVRSINADGGTNLPPALEAAHEALKNVRAEIKHIIVLSDGVSQNRHQIPGIVRAMAADDIRVSTIAVGDDADSVLMSGMAEDGGGKFYRVTDPNLLPRIFIKAVRTMRSPLVREQPFTPTVLPTGSPVLDGLGNPPPLNGLNLTQARLDATVVTPLATPTGEPVLAHWSVGLGRVAAFTSDAYRWGAPWQEWGGWGGWGGSAAAGGDGYARFWTQLARFIARSPVPRTQTLLTTLEGDILRIRFEAADDTGRPLEALEVPASIYLPDGERRETILTQVGPGTYEAHTPAPSSGTYIVVATPRSASGRLPPALAGVSRPSGIEYRRLASNPDLLTRISEATAGRVLSLSPDSPYNLFDHAGTRPAIARLPLWRPLLYWLVALMLFDIAMRRIAWDRFFSRDFGVSLAQEAADALRDRTAQARQTINRLRQRDEARGLENSARPDAALTDTDALEVIRAERARRARERPSPFTRQPVNPPPTSTPAQPAAPADPETASRGLHAAKRRARSRMDEDSPP